MVISIKDSCDGAVHAPDTEEKRFTENSSMMAEIYVHEVCANVQKTLLVQNAASAYEKNE